MKANACQFFIICGMANRICTKIETTVTDILRDYQTFIGKLYQRVAPAALAFVSEKVKPRSVNCLRREACIFNVLAA